MSSTTTHYNVYRVTFIQSSGPNHEGLALVPAQFADQGAGRFYHVVGDVGMGMDYQKRGAYKFGVSKSYNDKEYLFQIKRESLEQWEAICESHPAPHDPRVLTDRKPNPPAPNCTTWVDKVVQDAKSLAV